MATRLPRSAAVGRRGAEARRRAPPGNQDAAPRSAVTSWGASARCCNAKKASAGVASAAPDRLPLIIAALSFTRRPKGSSVGAIGPCGGRAVRRERVGAERRDSRLPARRRAAARRARRARAGRSWLEGAAFTPPTDRERSCVRRTKDDSKPWDVRLCRPLVPEIPRSAVRRINPLRQRAANHLQSVVVCATTAPVAACAPGGARRPADRPGVDSALSLADNAHREAHWCARSSSWARASLGPRSPTG